MDIFDESTIKYGKKQTTVLFKQIIEDHVSFLRSKSTRHVPIDENTITKWAGDFCGLLHELNVDPNLHYATARINGLDSVCSDYSHLDSIMLVDEPTFSSIVSRHREK